MTQFNLSRIWRKKWMLLVWTVVGAGAGFAFSHFNDSKHEAAARLLVERTPAPLDERDPVWDRNFMPTQAEIAASPAVVSAASESVAVANSTEVIPLSEIVANLQVAPLVGANVLSFRYRNEDPRIAAQMIEEIIRHYSAFLLENERAYRQGSLMALEARQFELLAQEQRLIDRRNDQRREHPLSGLASEAAKLPQEMVAMRLEQVTQTQSRRILVEQQLISLELLDVQDQESNDPTDNVQLTPVSVRDSSTGTETSDRAPNSMSGEVAVRKILSPRAREACVELLRNGANDQWTGLPDARHVFEQLSITETQIVELAGRVGPNHRELIAARNRNTALEGQLDDLIDMVPNILIRAYERSLKEEQLATDAYEAELARIAVLDEMMISDRQLSEDLDRVRFELDEVSSQLTRRRLVNQSETTHPMTVTVQVLEEPALLTKPLMISQKLIIVLGAAFGMFGGLCMTALGGSQEAA